MKPPVDAPTSRAASPGRIDLERVERGRELVAAAADVRLGGLDGHRRPVGDEVARLVVEPRRVARPDTDLAREDERLTAGARLDEASLDEELVEPDALRPR